VYIVTGIKKSSSNYGHICVDVKQNALWLDLKSDLAGKTFFNDTYILRARQIFADGKEVVEENPIPNDPKMIIKATVNFGVLCITC
jgi:hypothetical protein